MNTIRGILTCFS